MRKPSKILKDALSDTSVLQGLIERFGFSYIWPDFTPENFPLPSLFVIRRGIKFIRMPRQHSTEEALEAIEKRGGSPANIYELLTYKAAIEGELKRSEYVTAFGSLYTNAEGTVYAPGIRLHWDKGFQLHGGSLNTPWMEKDLLAYFKKP